MLAEAGSEPGGRVSLESRLPGLSEWARVRDWRLQQLTKLPGVELYLESPMSAADALGCETDHILVATGAEWRRDGVGIHRATAIDLAPDTPVFSPDDIMAGNLPDGPVALYDDDTYYMSATIAMALRQAGREVMIISAHPLIGPWTKHTEELGFTNAQLRNADVAIHCNEVVSRMEAGRVTSSCQFTGREVTREARSLVVVTAQRPKDELFRELETHPDRPGTLTLQRIGDCRAPGIIAHAVYSGHRAARLLGAAPETEIRHEAIRLDPAG